MSLLRQDTRHPLWRKPRHYMDADHSSDHVHWIELFYDLVHVVAIFVLGNFLSHHLDMHGFLIFAGMFCTLWFAWVDASWFNSLYVSTDIFHRFYMTGLIITVMICSAAMNDITHGGFMFFAIGFAINRFLIAWLYWRARKIGDSTKALPTEMARNYAITGAVFLVSAFLPSPFS